VDLWDLGFLETEWLGSKNVDLVEVVADPKDPESRISIMILRPMKPLWLRNHPFNLSGPLTTASRRHQLSLHSVSRASLRNHSQERRALEGHLASEEE